MKKSTKDIIQWHPAFFASLQIEFEKEAEKLNFESEHLLSKKPMQMDALIIKLEGNESLQKNIGQIFRKYNIIEYKSPDDHLTINDFYKVYGYCCFYQSDTNVVCEIPPEELTITFVCNHFPRKMIQHLKNFRGLSIAGIEPGIYYITGDAFPIQLLIINELNPNENRWLQSLRNDITKIEDFEPLFKEYENNKSSTLYQSAIDVITRANWNTIKEAKKDMCEALKELMAEEFQEHEEQVTNQIIRNAYESLHDINKVAQILKLSVEQVEKAVAPNNSI